MIVSILRTLPCFLLGRLTQADLAVLKCASMKCSDRYIQANEYVFVSKLWANGLGTSFRALAADFNTEPTDLPPVYGSPSLRKISCCGATYKNPSPLNSVIDMVWVTDMSSPVIYFSPFCGLGNKSDHCYVSGALGY